VTGGPLTDPRTGPPPAGRPGSGPDPDVAVAGGDGRKLRQLAELPVSVLWGVGAAAARELAELGIESVLDLLTHYPRRYIDGTRLVPIADLTEGEKASVLGEVMRVSRPSGNYGRGRRRAPSRVVVEVSDGSGSLQVVFFNQSWRAKQLAVGSQVLFFGTVGSYRGQLQLTGPTAEVLGTRGETETEAGAGTEGAGTEGAGTEGAGTEGGGPAVSAGRVFPVYPLSDKTSLTSARIGRYAGEALDRAGTFADPLGERSRRRFDLVGRTTAFNDIHRPTTMDDHGSARRRLAFDELFRLQLALVLRQARLQGDARGIRHVVARPDGSPTLAERFLDQLPFEPTDAQRRALEVIRGDLAGPLPMHRLLQGDVGSGKTVVAVGAMLTAVEGGHQAALMAPTEVLAEQHAAAVRSLVDGLTVPDPATLEGSRPLAVALLTSKTGSGERAALHQGLADGTVDLLIGTHALLTEEVGFRSLGVVVIDEQHRFGVEQRAALRAKGRGDDGSGHDPDLLVMTATPIPRTAAMVVFGDLDMTILDELPAGRLPVTTSWLRTPLETEEAWSRVRAEVAEGGRAFVVCPLVDGSERVEATSAVAEAERLSGAELAGLRLGLLHGQLPSAEKERVMADFRRGDLDVLVATTVIEVGVDIPEATVMVIEDADRFGIAQLHQLRGRVGRGGDPSWCYLLSENDTPEAAARLGAMEASTDGFELADVDLELRGEGTILGARQKGRSDLKLARLLSDGDLVVHARELAEELVADDPELAGHALLVDELRIFIDEDEAEFLFKS
jgi:ATP-dependent DNA helicase RecG